VAYRVAGGAPLSIGACSTCAAAIDVTPSSITSLDHLSARPADGVLLTLSNGTLYRIAGGAPLRLDGCPVAGGCSGAVGVEPSTISTHDHMNAVPSAGTVLLLKPSGMYYSVRADGSCAATGASGSAVTVSDSSYCQSQPSPTPSPTSTPPPPTPTPTPTSTDTPPPPPPTPTPTPTPTDTPTPAPTDTPAPTPTDTPTPTPTDTPAPTPTDTPSPTDSPTP
jgi:hypothetical protein